MKSLNQDGKAKLVLVVMAGLILVGTWLSSSGQTNQRVGAQNYVAITPTGTITPTNPTLWVPWSGSLSGSVTLASPLNTPTGGYASQSLQNTPMADLKSMATQVAVNSSSDAPATPDITKVANASIQATMSADQKAIATQEALPFAISNPPTPDQTQVPLKALATQVVVGVSVSNPPTPDQTVNPIKVQATQVAIYSNNFSTYATQVITGINVANPPTPNQTIVPASVQATQIAVNGANQSTASLQNTMLTPVWNISNGMASATTAASAPSTGMGILGRYDTTAPTLTTGQSYLLPLDARGDLKVGLYNASAQLLKLVPTGATGIAADANTTQLLIQPMLYNASNSVVPIREIDGVSNTMTALGVAAVAFPDYYSGPTTFVATGTVTFGPFNPCAANHEFRITTTGTITTAAVTFYNALNNINFDKTGGGIGNKSLSSFSGTSNISVANSPGKYVLTDVTISVLGGTNIIIDEYDGR